MLGVSYVRLVYFIPESHCFPFWVIFFSPLLLPHLICSLTGRCRSKGVGPSVCLFSLHCCSHRKDNWQRAGVCMYEYVCVLILGFGGIYQGCFHSHIVNYHVNATSCYKTQLILCVCVTGGEKEHIYRYSIKFGNILLNFTVICWHHFIISKALDWSFNASWL